MAIGFAEFAPVADRPGRAGSGRAGEGMGTHDLLQRVARARARSIALRSRLKEEGPPPDAAEFARTLDEAENAFAGLQAQHDLLGEILDRTSDAVFAKDRAGRYTMVNLAGAELLGRTKAEIVGRNAAACFEREDAQRILTGDREVMASGEPRTFEQTLRFPRGPRRVLTTKSPRLDRRGGVRGLIETWREVAVSKSTEHEIALRGDRLLAMAAEIVIAEERLRRSLAADLDNGLAQDIALAKMRLSHMRQSVSAELHAPLKEIEYLIEQADRSVRSITYRISPPSLHDLGLVAALEWLAEDVANAYGLAVRIEDEGRTRVGDERIRVIFFRAVRELLVNAATHGRAREARVRLAANDGILCVTVEDEGIGFDTAGLGPGGHGLFGIREQLRYVGGDLDIHSERGRGTRVRLTAPNETEPSPCASRRRGLQKGLHRSLGA